MSSCPPASSRSAPLVLPPDSRITIDALMLAALSVGQSRIDRLATGVEVETLITVLRELGVTIEIDAGGSAQIWGLGISGLLWPRRPLPVTGATLPLLLGSLAGHPFESILADEGDLDPASLTGLLEPLAAMGVETGLRTSPRFPLVLAGRGDLMPIVWTAEGPMPRTDLLRTLLLAGLHAPGVSKLILPAMPFDPLPGALALSGATLATTTLPDGGWQVEITGQPDLRPRDWTIPGDRRIAMCLIAAAACRPGANLHLTELADDPGLDWLQAGLGQSGATFRDGPGQAPASGQLRELQVLGQTPSPIVVDAARLDPGTPFLYLAAALSRGPARSVLRGAGRTAGRGLLHRRIDALAAAGLALSFEGDDLLAGGGKASASGPFDPCGDDDLAIAYLVAADTPGQALASFSPLAEAAQSGLRHLFIDDQAKRHA